jgi:hypothetical protein
MMVLSALWKVIRGVDVPMSGEVCRHCMAEIPEHKLIEERVVLPPVDGEMTFGGGTYLTAFYCSRRHQRRAKRDRRP